MAQEIIKEHIQPQSFLAAGGSGIIYTIDDKRILKTYYDEGIDVERRAFERLGSHKNIVKYFGATRDGLVLERGQLLRTVIQASEPGKIPLNTKIRWLREAAEGTRYIHDKKIIHADVGCNNWILVQGHLKIIDFEGCSIDGEEAGACYEWFSYKEPPVISRKTDIFAFGCAVYEVITGKQPYQELLEFDNRILRVRQLYSRNQFPEVKHIPLGSLILGCWQGTLNSMREVLQELESVKVAASPQE